MSGAAADAMRPPPPARLRIRGDFLRVSSGMRVHSRSLSLQAAPRPQAAEPRVGLTVTRKVGGAVERNRIKRRLREALRAELPVAAGHDFVVVARREALSTPFPALIAELRRCFEDHRAGRARTPGPRRKPGSSKADAKSRPSAKTELAAGRSPAARDLRPDREPA